MRWNPISDKRYQVLHKQIVSKLQKIGRSAEIPAIELQLQHLGTADPTVTGKYCKWIAGLILSKNIFLPEDSQKLQEILAAYHRVKPRLSPEQRSIDYFKSYHQLRATLLPLLPQLRSVAELEREGTQPLFNANINDAYYEIIQLLTPEAAAKAAKNTGWCVCNLATAKGYLDTGPLYLVLREGKRHALAHRKVGAGVFGVTVQIMDVDDIPINPQYPEHFYEDVVTLFSGFLPQFLCPDHSYLYTGKKAHFARFLFNLVCEGCATPGCAEDMKLCEYKEEGSCSEAACEHHQETCISCGITLCNSHQITCCGTSIRRHTLSVSCQNCLFSCEECSITMCEECANYVECCDVRLCSGCIATCVGCAEDYCSNCANLEECDLCREDICISCRNKSDWTQLECDHSFCSHCVKKLTKCDSCGEYRCPPSRGWGGCGENRSCELCGNLLCDTCGEYCHDCENSFCEECESQECDSCGDHTHATVECKYARGYEGCGLDSLCDTCAKNCYDCKQPLCPEHQIACDCPPITHGVGARKRAYPRHTYCRECYPRNVCTVCKTTTCILENHMVCAYTPRKRRF